MTAQEGTDNILDFEQEDEILSKIREMAEEDGDDSFMNDFWRGQQGLGIGVLTPLKEHDKYLFGIQPSTYYLIGAESGAGKTTFTDFLFFFSLYYTCKVQGVPLKIHYYSYEINKKRKRQRLVSYLLYERYKMRISVNDLSGKSRRKFKAAELKAIVEVNDEVKAFMGNIYFHDEPLNPTGVYKELMQFARNNGEFQEEEYIQVTLKEDGTKTEKPGKRIVGYKPNNPSEMVVVITDHVALSEHERGYDTKRTIDKHSEYGVYFRNRCGYTWVDIQQFNTELTSAYRKQENEHSIAPQRIDFGDSKYTYRNADIVIGLVNPSLYEIERICGYSVKRFFDKLILSYIMKNRDGEASQRIPMMIDPVPCKFIELKRESELREMDDLSRENYMKTVEALAKSI